MLGWVQTFTTHFYNGSPKKSCEFKLSHFWVSIVAHKQHGDIIFEIEDGSDGSECMAIFFLKTTYDVGVVRISLAMEYVPAL